MFKFLKRVFLSKTPKTDWSTVKIFTKDSGDIVMLQTAESYSGKALFREIKVTNSGNAATQKSIEKYLFERYGR